VVQVRAKGKNPAGYMHVMPSLAEPALTSTLGIGRIGTNPAVVAVQRFDQTIVRTK
jgi:hypothetical protein